MVAHIAGRPGDEATYIYILYIDTNSSRDATHNYLPRESSRAKCWWRKTYARLPGFSARSATSTGTTRPAAPPSAIPLPNAPFHLADTHPPMPKSHCVHNREVTGSFVVPVLKNYKPLDIVDDFGLVDVG